ncbi:MAG: acetyltransferase [Planctomycetota bacterium]
MIQAAHSIPPLVIVGAGDHGQVVADAAHAAGHPILGHLDDDPSRPNLLSPDDPRLDAAHFIVGIGDNAARLRVFRQLVADGRTFANVIHPSAVVSPAATLGQGVYLGPLAIVGPDATLGDAVIVNSAAVVEHHGHLADAVHVAPAAALAGRVTVGPETLVGLGAKILPGVTLGQRCVVGAGAVVTQDLPDDTTAVGVPARPNPGPRKS